MTLHLRCSAFFLATLLSAQWTPQNSGTTASLRGVSAVDGNAAWASGTKGTYLRTVDGGAIWKAGQVDGAADIDFRDIHAVDDRIAYLMSAGPGRASRIYKTIDGGGSWRLQYENTQEKGFFDSIAFWNPKRGIVLGDPVDGKFVLLTTRDGGRHWTPVEGAPAAREGEAAFAASGTCIVTGRGGRAWIATGGTGGGRILRSTDYGRTWQASETPIRHEGNASGIFSVAFLDGREGIAVGGNYEHPAEGRDNIAISHDGGKTWNTPSGTHPGGFRSAVAFLPGSHRAIATGTSGTSFSDEASAGWTDGDATGYNALSFAASSVGWAVGPKGVIGRYSGPKNR
ncbi:MAG: hypothetical protein ABI823_15250 [Bryobacteraceae bacterium]